MTLEEFNASCPPYRRLFWADGESLGETVFHREPLGQSFSEYFLCSVCRQIWGMLEYPNRHWMPLYVTCREHRDARSAYCLPGSMLSPGYISPEELDTYPEAFIRREFELHLTQAEKELAL